MPPVSLDSVPAPLAPALPDSPAPGALAPVAPPAPPVPASPDSPPAPGAETDPAQPGDPQADQRIKDGQRKITQQAEALKLKDTEIVSLQQALAVTLQHPAFRPVPHPEAPPAAEGDAGDWIRAYQQAPDDTTALRLMAERIEQAEKNGETRALRALEQRQATAINRARAAQAQKFLTDQVSQIVTSAAPDVPLELFWSYKDRVHAETPVELHAPDQMPARMQWQIERALTLARAAMDPQRLAVANAAALAAGLARTAAPSMAPGSNAPGGRPGAPANAAPSMTEQLYSRRTQMGL